jgi:hypothetical protein
MILHCLRLIIILLSFNLEYSESAIQIHHNILTFPVTTCPQPLDIGIIILRTIWFVSIVENLLSNYNDI